MIKAARIVLVISLAFCLAACASSRERHLKKRYLANDYPYNSSGLKRVAVVALDACTQYHPDLMAFTSALHSQLQSIEGLEVLPDGAALAAISQGSLALPRDGLKLADSLGADGLFVAVITDYNPYGEPVLAVGLMLFARTITPISRPDLDKIIQGGMPIALPESYTSGPVAAVFDVYDVSQRTTRHRVELYAAGQASGEVGPGWERYYRSMPHFMRFVTYEIVWSLFTDLEAQKAVKASRRR